MYRRYTQNLDKRMPDKSNKYGIPRMECVRDFSLPDNWIPFSAAISYKGDRSKTGVHFYIHDYQFERVWNDPIRYANILTDFKCVISPDFSLYEDQPLAMSIWNLYRNNYLGAFFVEMGITVIPNICWSEEIYDFSMYPKNSIVAVSTVGCLKDRYAKGIFVNGYKKMIEELTPTKVICHGKKVSGLMSDNVICVNAFYENIK